MRSIGRHEQAIASLLKAARLRADELRARRADIETERASAEAALDWLEQALRTEEVAAAGQPELGPALINYQASAAARRRNLTASVEKLGHASAQMADALAEAFMEIRKLELLLEARRSSAAAEAARIAERNADDDATRRRTAGCE